MVCDSNDKAGLGIIFSLGESARLLGIQLVTMMLQNTPLYRISRQRLQVGGHLNHLKYSLKITKYKRIRRRMKLLEK